MVKTSCLPKTLKCQILCGFQRHKASTSIVTPHLLLLYMGCWPMAGSTFQNFVRYLWCSSLPAIICFPKQRETPPEGKLSFSRTQHIITQGGLRSRLFKIDCSEWQCIRQDIITLTLWSPKSDQHPISFNSITPESNIKVMRIKKMITNWRGSWLLNKFSLPALEEMYREHYGEYAYWC